MVKVYACGENATKNMNANNNTPLDVNVKAAKEILGKQNKPSLNVLKLWQSNRSGKMSA
ncbi:MAG: hypothetical protein MJ210_01435 [Alphaproteobacteria bacterium]|nr:hypothetical protein [Alphaproteobacteria bacterium]